MRAAEPAADTAERTEAFAHRLLLLWCPHSSHRITCPHSSLCSVVGFLLLSSAMLPTVSLVTSFTSDRHCFVSPPAHRLPLPPARFRTAGTSRHPTRLGPHSHRPFLLLLFPNLLPLPTPSSPPLPRLRRLGRHPPPPLLPPLPVPVLLPRHLPLPPLLPPHPPHPPLPSPPPSPSITIHPLTPDDWEILSLSPSHLELHLLQQLQVVGVGQAFPYFLDGGRRVECRVEAIKGAKKGTGGGGGAYGRLGMMTEVVVVPNVRKGKAVGGAKGDAVDVGLIKRWRLRVQRWEDREEAKAPPFPTLGRCVHVSEATLRNLRLKEGDLVVLSLPTSTTSSSHSPSDGAARVVCRVQVDVCALPHHILIPPLLLSHLRLPYFHPVLLSPLHPHLATPASKSVHSLTLTPLLTPSSSSPAPPPLPLPPAEEAALTHAFLIAVQKWGKEGVPVESGGVVEVDGGAAGSGRWRLRVGVNEARLGKARAGAEGEAERKREDDATARAGKMAVSLPSPLLFFLLCDPQPLPVVTTKPMPPLPLPLPTVLTPLASPPSLPACLHPLTYSPTSAASPPSSPPPSPTSSPFFPPPPPLLLLPLPHSFPLPAFLLRHPPHRRGRLLQVSPHPRPRLPPLFHPLHRHPPLPPPPLPPQTKPLPLLRALLTSALSSSPSLVLVDDAHNLFPSSSSSSDPSDAASSFDADALASVFASLVSSLPPSAWPSYSPPHLPQPCTPPSPPSSPPRSRCLR